ncbi:HAD family phosphatase [Streptomyces sp. NBC_01613]|uniref:HAD family hydrolase n=1 Tax=Streptomyces sp. NBC_01613 TaxID=2975896 RepID=UPI0038695378
MDELRSLVTQARYVLFGFDGLICRLFAGHATQRLATDLVEWLERQGLSGLLTEEEAHHLDPYTVLRAVGRRHPASDLVAQLEERLMQEELNAAPSAMPTAYAEPLIRTWTAVGVRLAVTSDASPAVVHTYLESRGLNSCFAPHLYGRTQDFNLLSPDPHCFNRALRAMGADPSVSLVIGATPSDFHAAQQAGMPFLGYACNDRTEKLLREAGAEHVVTSLEPVLLLVRGL